MTEASVGEAARRRGHSEKAVFVAGPDELELFYAPDAELDGRFEATCALTGDHLEVSGWLWTSQE